MFLKNNNLISASEQNICVELNRTIKTKNAQNKPKQQRKIKSNQNYKAFKR